MFWKVTLSSAIIFSAKDGCTNWISLSRIWRILQIEEDVIHRGRRRRWITPSEICRILHILRWPKSIIALLFIQNNSNVVRQYFAVKRVESVECPPDSSAILFKQPKQLNLVPRFPRSTVQYDGSIWQIIDPMRSFWRHRFNMTVQQLVMMNCACGFTQSETGKYFEWMINNYSPKAKLILLNNPRDEVEGIIQQY